MNSDELKGKWKQLTGSVKEKWSKLTDDEINRMEGNSDQLIGKIQERYGKTKEQARDEVNDWLSKHK